MPQYGHDDAADPSRPGNADGESRADEAPERVDIPALFAERNIRCTSQRACIYAALASTAAHPTAEELFEMVQPSHPGLSLATVYNTLDLFTRTGLCRRLSSSNTPASGPARYDADVKSHVHLFTADGRVHDLPPQLAESVLDSLPPQVASWIARVAGAATDRLRIDIVVDRR